jgi:hypothetical protein
MEVTPLLPVEPPPDAELADVRVDTTEQLPSDVMVVDVVPEEAPPELAPMLICSNSARAVASLVVVLFPATVTVTEVLASEMRPYL